MNLKLHFQKNPLFWIAAIISIVLDHLTKFWVVQNFQLEESRALWPDVFNLTYVTNTGAAFSLFSNGGVYWLRWLSLIVKIGRAHV